MQQLVRWQTESGSIVVEGDGQGSGYGVVKSKPGEIAERVGDKFEDALRSFRDSAASALAVFKDDVLHPDEVEIEFGLKLAAEAGVVLAKAATEGHLVVKLKWARADGTE